MEFLLEEPAHIQAKQVTKTFPGTKALDNVDFEIKPGEVHALIGENGAGKSTLVKVLGGVHIPDQGKLSINNNTVSFSSPRDAIENGIVVIHQELSLVPDLSIEENILLGYYPVTRYGTISRSELRETAQSAMDKVGLTLDLATPVRELSVAQQQMVEIARALSLDAKVMIFDEPTASLSQENVENLFEVIRRLQKQQLGIVYISHLLDEIFELADCVTVLRDGQLSGYARVEDIDKEWMLTSMVGRKLNVEKPDRKPKLGDMALEVKNLTREGAFHDVSFNVRQGEIVGITGLVGSGRTEVLRAIYGADQFDQGELRVFGKPTKFKHPRQAVQAGLALVPEDRKQEGLFLIRPITENVTIANQKKIFRFPTVRTRLENDFVQDLVERLAVRLRGIDQEVQTLSGGNQQKVVLARWLGSDCRILILDEPTIGVDVGAKQEIYRLIDSLAENGLAIIVVSSEMEETFRLCDRIVVLRNGRVTAELDAKEATQEAIGRASLLDEEDNNVSSI